MTAKLTVVIPTHDRAALLPGAIASVLSSPLIDSPRDVIVVDDLSSDATPEVAARTGVRYERGRLGSPSASRNAGLALAKTEFVAFLDDDDEWLPGNMEPQLQALSRDRDAAYAYGRVQMVAPNGMRAGEPYPYPPIRSGRIVSSIFLRPPQVGAVLFRRSTVVAAGGFDVRIRFGEDWDLLIRLAAAHPVIGVDFVGSLFRQRPPSMRDGEARWRAHRDFARLRRKWRAAGYSFPLRARIAENIHQRGLTAYQLCHDAQAVLAAGAKNDAMRLIGYSMRVSPLHTLLRQPVFWKVLAGGIFAR